MNLFIRILTLLFSITVTFPCYAEPADNDFIFRQKKFIINLYEDKRYFDCIAEMQRLLYYENNPASREEMNYFINSCYYYGAQYKTVISRLESGKYLEHSRLHSANLFLLSSAYYNTGYFDKSINILYNTGYPDMEEKDRDKLFVNRIERLIKRYEYKNVLSETDHACKYISGFNSIFKLDDFRDDMQKYGEIGLRSKWLSAGLSALVPGAGQVYSGRVADGIVSFAAVAGSACGAYFCYHNNEKPLALTLTFFSGLFYCGNIYGAWNAALYKNNKLNREFSGRIIEKYRLEYSPEDYIDSSDYFSRIPR